MVLGAQSESERLAANMSSNCASASCHRPHELHALINALYVI